MPGALDKLAITAERLLNKFGKEVTYTKKTRVDPTAAEIAEGDLSGSISTADYDVLIAPPEALTAVRAAQTVKDAEYTTVLKALNLPFRPGNTDSIDLDGIAYTVVDVKAIYSGNIVAIYELSLNASKAV